MLPSRLATSCPATYVVHLAPCLQDNQHSMLCQPSRECGRCRDQPHHSNLLHRANSLVPCWRLPALFSKCACFVMLSHAAARLLLQHAAAASLVQLQCKQSCSSQLWKQQGGPLGKAGHSSTHFSHAQHKGTRLPSDSDVHKLDSTLHDSRLPYVADTAASLQPYMTHPCCCRQMVSSPTLKTSPLGSPWLTSGAQPSLALMHVVMSRCWAPLVAISQRS